MQQTEYSVAIIGAGASGITAAINASQSTSSVIILERLLTAGKKILASGGGRCNILPVNFNAQAYNLEAIPLVKSIFAKFGYAEIEKFFKGLGLNFYTEGKRIFPVTNQASSVLKLLELELKRKNIKIEPGFCVQDINFSQGAFVIKSAQGKSIRAKNVILCAGGESYTALGSDGSGFKLAKKLGHSIVEPVPAAVALVNKDKHFHFLQ